MNIFKNNEYPKRSNDDIYISVDVITYDIDGLLNIGYYNFVGKKWKFHTGTLIDPYEEGLLIDFVWMYKPESLSVAKKNDIKKNEISDEVWGEFLEKTTSDIKIVKAYEFPDGTLIKDRGEVCRILSKRKAKEDLTELFDKYRIDSMQHVYIILKNHEKVLDILSGLKLPFDE